VTSFAEIEAHWVGPLSTEAFLRLALAEDIGTGDHTTLACIPGTQTGHAVLKIKEDGVVAGLEVAVKTFHLVDAALEVDCFCQDGQEVRAGQVALEVRGALASVLRSERLVLNMMQRMSGIATRTRAWSRMIAHTSCRLLDTRKTTPLNRALEKEAVRLGGGINHRMGLYDAVLVKDNHVDACGGIVRAVQAVNAYLEDRTLRMPVVVEVRNLAELEQLCQTTGVDRVLLDNFEPALLRTAVQWLDGRFQTEASGNIREDNLVAYAETGVDFVSVGALTHSVKAMDLSLKVVLKH